MKLKATDRKKSYYWRLQPNQCDLQPIQRNSWSSKEQCDYHNNFFFKKSPQEILQNLKTLRKQHRASDGDENFSVTNPNPICIPSPT